MRKLYTISLFCLLIIFPVCESQCQELSYEDKYGLIVTSKNLISTYEGLLNELADETISDMQANFRIRQSYSPGREQIFYEEEVVIESDLDPQVLAQKTTPENIFVSNYLQYFRLFYEKSTSSSVEFTAIEPITDIEEGDYLYLRIYFESEFKNGHKDIKEPYPKTQRVAEIKIERVDNQWVPLINGISFFKEAETTSIPQVDDTSQPNISLNPTENPEEIARQKPNEEVDSLTPKEGIDDEPKQEPSPDEVTVLPNANAFKFNSPSTPRVLKYGETMNVSWQKQDGSTSPVDLRLVRKGEAPQSLVNDMSRSTFSWSPQKGQVKSGTYQFEVVSKDDPMATGRSIEFKVKSKFPTLLAAIGSIGVAVAVYFITRDPGPDPPITLPPGGPMALPDAPIPSPDDLN